MKQTILVVAMVFALMSTGCRGSKKTSEASSGPGMNQTVENIRTRFQRVDPSVQVGAVASVSSASQTATIDNVNVENFHENDLVTFVDSSTNPIVNGKVIAVREQTLSVKYDAPTSGQRAPRAGDLIVKLK